MVTPLCLFLVLFNDPFYLVHIYSPSVMSFALSELQIALFVAGLMVYWIRDLAKYRKKIITKEHNVIGRLVWYSTGESRVVGCFLGVMFVLLTVDFWVIYMLFFFKVQGDPTFAGKINPTSEAI